MKKLKSRYWFSLMAMFGVLLLPGSALAYIGPGSGLSAIGAFLALIAALIVAIFGFVWYPIKRLLKKRKMKDQQAGEGEE